MFGFSKKMPNLGLKNCTEAYKAGTVVSGVLDASVLSVIWLQAERRAWLYLPGCLKEC